MLTTLLRSRLATLKLQLQLAMALALCTAPSVSAQQADPRWGIGYSLWDPANRTANAWLLNGRLVYAVQVSTHEPFGRRERFYSSLGFDFRSVTENRDGGVALMVGPGFARQRMTAWLAAGPALVMREERVVSLESLSGGLVDFSNAWTPRGQRLGGQATARFGFAVTRNVGLSVGASLLYDPDRTRQSAWAAIDLGILGPKR